MHVYHYAAYEQTALKRLTGRHGIREAELDRCCAASGSSTCIAVVRQGMRISKESYSIKKLEEFYWGHTRTAADAGWPTRWPASSSTSGGSSTATPRSWTPIADYNKRRRRLDPRAARLAGGAAGRAGGSSTAPLPRPATPRDGAGREAQSDAEVAEAELADRLHGRRAPAARPTSSAGTAARTARRGGTSTGCKDLDDEALRGRRRRRSAGCPRRYLTTATQAVQAVARTRSRRRTPRSARAGASRSTSTPQAEVGEVLEMDAAAGWLVLKVGRSRPAPTPARAGAAEARWTIKVLREAIAHVGGDVLAGRPPASGRRCSSAGCRAGLQAAAGGAAGDAGRPARARPRRRGARHPGAAGQRQDDRGGGD